jgi:hypothetical protein
MFIHNVIVLRALNCGTDPASSKRWVQSAWRGRCTRLGYGETGLSPSQSTPRRAFIIVLRALKDGTDPASSMIVLRALNGGTDPASSKRRVQSAWRGRCTRLGYGETGLCPSQCTPRRAFIIVLRALNGGTDPASSKRWAQSAWRGRCTRLGYGETGLCPSQILPRMTRRCRSMLPKTISLEAERQWLAHSEVGIIVKAFACREGCEGIATLDSPLHILALLSAGPACSAPCRPGLVASPQLKAG